ncbi:MAG: NADH-quinone oxidoreductase subunit M [Planctomycetales bacterium]|nr:NADH-quinone oxidoreductase subunit M [Planctomycetales bacterium]MCA9212417.1 NADH-quinone oxidoreductase subunit M [Planctomycetales bacterium]
MSESALLLISILLPLFGAVAVATVLSRTDVRQIALGIAIVTMLCSLLVVNRFDPQSEAVAAGEFAALQSRWLPESTGVDLQFSLAIDGLGIWLYGLSTILMLTAILVSWEAITERRPLFYAMLLLLESGCLGVFAARDLLLFYVFFEFTLIPLFFLIGIWGSEDRRYAATKFFVFTLAGSLVTFIGLLAIVAHAASVSNGAITFSIPHLTNVLQANPMPVSTQKLIFIALFAGFAIKVPLFPLHTWLPLAHVQAPTAGSVFLAGILLKIGTYGFLRFSIPMLPDASVALAPVLLWLSVIGIIYGAFVALAQTDMKRLIAYSSVSHLGFVVLGLFALNAIAIQGATLQMINHGISTGALFAIIGMLYERYHTRSIDSYSGLSKKMPIMAFFMLLFTFSSIGLPGLNGFAGEIMILLGTFQRAFGSQAGLIGGQRIVAVLAVSGVVLGAWYMLWLVKRVFFGTFREPCQKAAHESRDLCFREIAALVPLAILVFWIGLYPKYFLDRMAPTLNASTSQAVAKSTKRIDDNLASSIVHTPPRTVQP